MDQNIKIGLIDQRVWWLFFALALAGVILFEPTYAQDDSRQLVLVEVEDLRPEPANGVLTDQIYFALHNGEFDIFDYHQPASDALATLINFGDPSALRSEAERFSGWRGTGSVRTFYPSWDEFLLEIPGPVVIPGAFLIYMGYPTAYLESARYFSFFSRIYPGDDTFVANEDPKRYPLFDENGEFAGPFVIDVYGSDILDAGVQVNDEQDLLLLDQLSFTATQAGNLLERTENNVVRPHPGFLGSLRGGGEPGRLLSDSENYCLSEPTPPGFFGSTVCLVYTLDDVDFTRPDYPLFRIRINASSRVIHGGWSGSYFSPARDGEGFSFEFFDDNPDRVTMFWYTYQNEGSGNQQWLYGEGKKVRAVEGGIRTGPKYVYEIDLFTTRGGRFASTQNPDKVQLIPWGSARLVESNEEGGRLDLQPACERLRLYDIQPLDSDIELDLPLDPDSRLPYYELIRLGPKLSGAESLCGQRTGYPF